MHAYWRHSVAFVLLTLTLSGCSVFEQLKQMSTLARCQFRLSAVDNLRVAGVNVQQVRQPSDLSVLQMAQIGTTFMSGRLPLDMVVNVQVKNPNSTPASLNSMDWILLIDDRQTVAGTVDRRLEVPANDGVATLPLNIGLDLREFFDGSSRDELLNLVLNLVGAGNQPTRLKLRVRPSIMVGGSAVQYPGYFDVDSQFSGL